MINTLLLDEVPVPENLHLLVLEDTHSYQKKMISDLSDIGFKGKISVAISLAEAFECFKKEKPGLVLCADGVGSDLLKAVRSKSQLNDLPFLMMSTISDIDNILEATNDGADGYIVKPWSKQDLIEQIAFAYNKRKKPEPISIPE